MSDAKTCPTCGAALASDATRGVCPACLLEAGLATDGAPAAGGHVPTIEELAPKFPGLAIEALIGRGGMGVVFRARQKALDREVALKILAASVAADPAFADRFQREARALAKLQHPNIVGVYDFGATDGLFWLLMEYVDGVNVRDALKAGHIGPKEALTIVPQICDALQYAHERGVVHRDIKPENLLLDKAGRVKVADFGLAKLMDRAVADASLTGAGQVMGTLHYMAPEQWEHPKDVDHRADIYSLGVVFYEMLTGELPVGRFAAPSTKSDVDARIDEIVLRTLEREREARYQQVSQVKTAVGVVTSSPAAASPSPAAVVANVPEAVNAGLGRGLRRQLLVAALLAMLGSVFWAVNDREIVWLVLPLAGLALMGIAVWYRIRGAAPAPSWAPKLEFTAGMLLVAAGLMGKMKAPTGDERAELAMVAIAVGWFMAAFGAPVIVAETRYSPAGRKAVVGFLAVAAVAAGIVSAVGLVRVSKFAEHEPTSTHAPTGVGEADALVPAVPSAERPKYEPAPSDAGFPPEFVLRSSIAGLETPDLRALKAAWAKLVQAAASRDVDAVIDLYEPAERESLRAMAKDPAQRLVFAEDSRQGRLGMPLMAFARGADKVAEMRFMMGSISQPTTFGSEPAVTGLIDTPRDKNKLYNRVEIFGVVHTDAQGQWIEWFFRKKWSGKQG